MKSRGARADLFLSHLVAAFWRGRFEDHPLIVEWGPFPAHPVGRAQALVTLLDEGAVPAAVLTVVDPFAWPGDPDMALVDQIERVVGRVPRFHGKTGAPDFAERLNIIRVAIRSKPDAFPDAYRRAAELEWNSWEPSAQDYFSRLTRPDIHRPGQPEPLLPREFDDELRTVIQARVDSGEPFSQDRYLAAAVAHFGCRVPRDELFRPLCREMNLLGPIGRPRKT